MLNLTKSRYVLRHLALRARNVQYPAWNCSGLYVYWYLACVISYLFGAWFGGGGGGESEFAAAHLRLSGFMHAVTSLSA